MYTCLSGWIGERQESENYLSASNPNLEKHLVLFAYHVFELIVYLLECVTILSIWVEHWSGIENVQ